MVRSDARSLRARLTAPGAAALALAVSLISGGAAQEPPSDLLDPAEREWLAARGGVIMVGPEANYPPFVFCREGAPPAGISIDYLRRIEAKLGVTFSYGAPAELSALLARVRAGELDVLTSLKRTPAREEFLRFTDPYIEVPAVIIVRRGATSEGLTLAELRGRRVAARSSPSPTTWPACGASPSARSTPRWSTSPARASSSPTRGSGTCASRGTRASSTT